MSDNGEESPKPIIDYNAIDEATGFRKADLNIWEAFKASVLNVSEDDRPDPESWAEEWAEENNYDKKRTRAVTILGIYGGPRDEFNSRTGCGRAFHPNGDIYDGEYSCGRRHGQGHYTFVHKGKSEADKLIEKMWTMKPPEETKADFVARCARYLHMGEHIVECALEFGFLPCYHGDYVRGVRSGQGLMKDRSGCIYKGDWAEGKRSGQGVFYYLNGDVYSGEWRNGLKNGFGAYKFGVHDKSKAGGCELRGMWADGVFKEGQWIFADGTYYEGKFDKKNRPCDPEGWMHFPGHNIAQNGLFKWDRWAPSNKLVVSEERPVQEDEWVK